MIIFIVHAHRACKACILYELQLLVPIIIIYISILHYLCGGLVIRSKSLRVPIIFNFEDALRAT